MIISARGKIKNFTAYRVIAVTSPDYFKRILFMYEILVQRLLKFIYIDHVATNATTKGLSGFDKFGHVSISELTSSSFSRIAYCIQ